jgi:ubiquinone/menaquinone biosynthesis C-methylase UbiE
VTDKTEKQKRYYNRVAKNFDRLDVIINRDNRNHLKKLKKVISLLKLHGEERIIEIGVGSGIHARYLLNWFPNLDFWGIDISEEMLKLAQDRLKEFKNVHLSVGDAQNTKFEDNFFDCVYYASTLHHIPNPELAFRETKRILKPHGRVVFMEPNRLFLKNYLAMLMIPEEKNIRLMTKENFLKWSRKYGFSQVEADNFLYTLPFPHHFFPLYDRLDACLPKIPFVNRFSFMIYCYGEK